MAVPSKYTTLMTAMNLRSCDAEITETAVKLCDLYYALPNIGRRKHEPISYLPD